MAIGKAGGDNLRADVARIVEQLRGFHAIWGQGKLDAGMHEAARGLIRALENTPAYQGRLSPRDLAFVRHFSGTVGHRTTL